MASINNLSSNGLAAAHLDCGSSPDRDEELRDKYVYGDRTKLRIFLTPFEVVSRMKPAGLNPGPYRVMYSALHLKGHAQEWPESTLADYVETEKPEASTRACSQKFSEFERKLGTMSGTTLPHRISTPSSRKGRLPNTMRPAHNAPHTSTGILLHGPRRFPVTEWQAERGDGSPSGPGSPLPFLTERHF